MNPVEPGWTDAGDGVGGAGVHAGPAVAAGALTQAGVDRSSLKKAKKQRISDENFFFDVYVYVLEFLLAIIKVLQAWEKINL